MLDYRTSTFLEVYRLGSFTAAARSLLITQPAVSQHIRQLESHYGCALFGKTGRGIEPTAAADMLYQRLLTLRNDESRLVAEAAAIAASSGADAAAPLLLGCTRTIADYVAPRLMSAYLSNHPGASIRMQAGNTRDLVEALERGDIDFALVEGSFDRGRFDFETLSREPYVAVRYGAPQGGGRSAPACTGSIRDLLGERLVLRESGSGTREILEKHLTALDLATSDFAGVIEFESIPTIKACVGAGAGISFMYRIAVERELERGELVDITPADFAIEHDFCLIWQRGSQYAPRYRALCEAWRRVL